ncbi:hypothetical protein B7939_00645 [Eggerthia catenaformis]|nr:hypothetical protein B7939_00645 [Eggerthia catenaformis]
MIISKKLKSNIFLIYIYYKRRSISWLSDIEKGRSNILFSVYFYDYSLDEFDKIIRKYEKQNI